MCSEKKRKIGTWFICPEKVSLHYYINDVSVLVGEVHYYSICVISEGGKTGQVIWSVNLNESGMVVDTIQLVFCSQVYESGQVNAVVCGADCCVKVPTGEHIVYFKLSLI